MRYIFEAIVVCSNVEELEHQLRNSPNGFDFMVHAIRRGVSAAFLNVEHGGPLFDTETDDALAEQLSMVFGKALLVLYNEGMSFRYAALYENGSLAHVFSDVDDIWVLLDANGEPSKEGQQFAYYEIEHEIEEDSENKYVCIKTNIDSGLSELTKSFEVSLQDLKSVI